MVQKRKLRPGRATAVSVAVKSALCLGLVPATGLAQDNAVDDEIEQITVTGSRIPRLDPQYVTPVQVYDSEFIQATGAASMQDFLFQASFAGPALFNENATLSQTAGTASFDSRGFGDDYVVILLNGRRLPGDPLGGDSATNLNLIPISAVDRVEYLSTGASAIYGADAVQGVINIITKQRYEGLDVSLRYGDSGDGGRTSLSATGGIASEKGYATVSFEFQQQEDVDAAGLPLIGSASAPGNDGRSPTGLPGTILDFTNGVAVPFSDCPAESRRTNSYGLAGDECAYDFAPLYDAIPAMDRFNLLVSGEYELGTAATGYAEFRMSRNVTEVRNGAAPAFFFIADADPEFLAELDAEYGTDFQNSAYLYIARRSVDAGPRATDNTNTAFSTVLGVRMDVGENHELDVSVQNVESEMNRIGVGGQISVSALSAAVASGVFDPRETYNPQFYADNGLSISTQRQAVGTENTASAQLSGTIGSSDIGYAFGAEHRTQSFDDRADVASTTGDVAGGASSNGNGERDNTAVFGEVSFNPIESVELRLAARWDDYNWKGLNTEAGDSASTYMAGVSWRPMDNLLLRASYGTGFKAPTLGELFLGRSFGVTRAVDTTLCNNVAADPSSTQADIDLACRIQEIQSVSGGNPNLKTESSDNYSVGFVFEPTDAWSIALDYYNIQVEDKIGQLTVQEILNNEAEFQHLVTRINGSVACRNGCEVRSNNQNLFEENGDGIDLSTRYDWDFDQGSMVVDLRTSYLMTHERQSSAVQPLCDDAGTTSEPEWRINGQLGWQADTWSTTLTSRFLGETTDYPGGRDSANFSCAPNPSAGTEKADSYLELGLRGTYNFNDQTTLSAGIINLTDEEPVFSPTAAGGWPFFDQALYDPRGRRYYLSVDYSFF
jgi:iron complex outermembrane recepter protein